MLYDMVNATQAARAPDSPGVRGYWYNHGGLNNQKMALIGLLLCGIRDRQTINLPYIYNKDLQTEQEYLVRFENVFHLDRIREFARPHGLTVLSDCPSGERGGWDCFEAFHGFFMDAMDRRTLEISLGAMSSLQPHIVSHPAFRGLRDFVFGSLGIDIVVQLRIESDWQYHFEHTLRPVLGGSEDNGLGFAEILSKVRNTFPDLKMIYATSDENAMLSSKNEIRSFCRSRFGLELLWKSDLLNPALTGSLTPLDLSLIDFEMAKYSPRFVGLTTSTFSNMLCTEKFASTGKPVSGHYIYNHPGDVVVERRDNGFAASVHRAVVPASAAALLTGGT